MSEEFIGPAGLRVPQAKKKSRISGLFVISLIALISSLGGAVISWRIATKEARPALYNDPARQKDDEIARAIESGGVVVLEPFVVNLADADAARYLRIQVSLMLDDKSRIKGASENEALQLKLRDIVLRILMRKHSQELITEEGKNQLRREILAQLEPYFRRPKLVDVMLSDFVIQL